jgi:hypothetical protein
MTDQAPPAVLQHEVLNGAGYKIRTRDPLITNQYLSLFYRTPDFSIVANFQQKTTYFRGFCNRDVKSAIDAD